MKRVRQQIEIEDSVDDVTNSMEQMLLKSYMGDVNNPASQQQVNNNNPRQLSPSVAATYALSTDDFEQQQQHQPRTHHSNFTLVRTHVDSVAEVN